MTEQSEISQEKYQALENELVDFLMDYFAAMEIPPSRALPVLAKLTGKELCDCAAPYNERVKNEI